MQDNYSLIGQRIKEYRKRSGFTQQQLAELINCDPSYISRIETGINTCSIEFLITLSQKLKTPVASFFVDIDNNIEPTTLSDIRLRNLFYQLSILDKKSTDYIINNIELFLGFIKS